MDWKAAERPDEDDAETIAYGADGSTIAEAMRMPDGTTHITTVAADLGNRPTDKEN